MWKHESCAEKSWWHFLSTYQGTGNGWACSQPLNPDSHLEYYHSLRFQLARDPARFGTQLWSLFPLKATPPRVSGIFRVRWAHYFSFSWKSWQLRFMGPLPVSNSLVIFHANLERILKQPKGWPCCKFRQICICVLFTCEDIWGYHGQKSWMQHSGLSCHVGHVTYHPIWFLSPWKGNDRTHACYSNLSSVCCDKYHDQNQPGEERV